MKRSACTGVVSFALGVLASVACAQEEPKSPPPQPAPAQPANADDAPSAPAAPEAADKVAERMADLYGRAAGDCPMPNPSEPDRKKLVEQIKVMDAWKRDVGALAAAADVYVARLGGAAPSAATLFQGGYGKARFADISPVNDAGPARADAVKLLQQALDALAADDGTRPDAAYWLGRTQLFLVPSGGARTEDAVANLRTAALGFSKAERREEAGSAVIAALKQLNASGRDAEGRAFVAAVGAAQADYGTKTALVRRLVNRSATGVGTPLPDLPAAVDADGKPIVWKDFRGAPFVLHFFASGQPTGHMSDQRDVETTLRPLFDRLHPKGLQMVGVSMDLALSKEKADKIRKDWEEWGTKERLNDGSKGAAAQWAEEQGVAWPWTWDGTWINNPISLALGGAGVNAAHAILVDAEGVIRWRGDAPFQGLSEAADKVVGTGEKK